MKLIKKALFVVSSTLMLASPAMSGEMPLDNLLSSLISSAVESTSSQLSEALATTMENIELFESQEEGVSETVQTSVQQNLPVGTTETE